MTFIWSGLKGVRLPLAGAVLGAVVGVGTPALAVELVYGSWLPEVEFTNRVALPQLFKEIEEETGGEVVWKLVPGGQLANPVNTWDAVESGLMQGGMGISTYAPSVVPNINAIYQTVRLGNDSIAATGAALETLLLDCPSCIEELKSINTVVLSGWSSSPYHFGCTSEVADLADMKGIKVRATGGNTRLMELAGATPVAATLVEAVSLLQTGAIDCVFGVAYWYRSFGYADFVKFHNDYPMGMTGPATGWIMNRDAWNELTDEQKQLHLKKGAMLTAMEAADQFIIAEKAALDWAVAEKGVTVVKGNADELGPLMEQFDVAQREVTIEESKKLGVPDPEAIIAAYDENFEKWKGLAEGIGPDTAKLAELYYNEIFAKIDLANF